MNPFIESLFLLQRQAATPEAAALRARIPAPVLAHFDRLISQGRKGVAEVHHGICGACHLRLPAAVVAGGPTGEDLALCENCGAYLRFPEATAAPAPLPAVRRPYRRRKAVKVAPAVPVAGG